LEVDEDFDDLPEDSEDVQTILAEMEALKAVFDAAFQGGPADRAVACVRQALNMRAGDPTHFEGQLTVFCMALVLGEDRFDVLPRVPTERRWARKTFEALALGWANWIRSGSKEVLQVIDQMHFSEPEEDDGAVETLSLNFWAKALEMLVKDRPVEAKKFFERANEVGAQFGTSTNPSICWTYAVSFFTREAHRR